MKKVRFYKNRMLDEIMADQFLDVKGGGIDFGKGILRDHPRLKLVLKHPERRKKIIERYCSAYYANHAEEMDLKNESIKHAWKKVENAYADVTEEYFGGFPFPDGKYIAYMSIINCNPRFLDQKTFQFFYKKSIQDATYTVAHELLHFIFFDFMNRRMKKEQTLLSEGRLWDLSEIFNIILLRSRRYVGIVNPEYVIPYPDHKKYIPQFQKAYDQSKNIEEFITRDIAILKK